MRPRLALYTRPGCHLCEEALGVLDTLDIRVEEVDVGAQASREDRYGTRIPVLRRADDGRELDWPFGPADISRLLAD